MQHKDASVSSPVIQNRPSKHNVGTKYDRRLKLETQAAQQAIAPTAEQIAQLEKQNPVVRERHVESGRPGALLCQGTFCIGRLKGVGKVYLHVAVNAYSSYAFGVLRTCKQPVAAAAVCTTRRPSTKSRTSPSRRSSPTMAGSSAAPPATHTSATWPSAARLNDGQVWRDHSAKLRPFLDGSGQFRRIHFAGHGVFAPARPLGSHLPIGSDEALGAEVVFAQCHLRADLATHSDCTTGASRVERPDELLGLPRPEEHAEIEPEPPAPIAGEAVPLPRRKCAIWRSRVASSPRARPAVRAHTGAPVPR